MILFVESLFISEQRTTFFIFCIMLSNYTSLNCRHNQNLRCANFIFYIYFLACLYIYIMIRVTCFNIGYIY